jgi:hypothetical protein
VGLLAQIQADVQAITSNANEFAFPVVFVSPDSPPTTATVNCTGTRHHNDFDNEGAPRIGRQASITVAEGLLTAAAYPVRNGNNEVNLKNHKCTWTDSAGISRTYFINKWMPDERLGLIVCILGDKA